MEKKILSIEERITKIKADSIQNEMEAIISEKTFIDLNHLDCFWYGGEIASFFYENFIVDAEVKGEVNVTLLDQNDEVICEYRNKAGDGTYESDEIRRYVTDDKHLNELRESGQLIIENNNWIEFFISDKNGNFITSVLEEGTDNVLEALNPAAIKDMLDDISKHYL